MSLDIRTECGGSDFIFKIRGRKNLEKLKETIDFALEIDEEKND